MEDYDFPVFFGEFGEGLGDEFGVDDVRFELGSWFVPVFEGEPRGLGFSGIVAAVIGGDAEEPGSET